MSVPERPGPELSRALARWLAGPRSRALRRARIGVRERVLEVGCGHGVVTGELVRRARGQVVALDRDAEILLGQRRAGWAAVPHCWPVAGDAEQLPFADASFDLVLFENVLLWLGKAEAAIGEAARVLRPGGCVVALEPDYGGMLEQPPMGLRDAWLDGLSRAGADPRVGRRLPGLCEGAGLDPWVELAHIPRPAEAEALALLDDLPLSDAERQAVAEARQRLAGACGEWEVFLHVPYVLVVAAHPRVGASRPS